MLSKSSAGPFFSSTRRAMAPSSRSQFTSAVMRRSSPSLSSRAIHSRMSTKLIAGLPFLCAERRRDLAEEALELADLIPRAEAQRHVADPGVEVRPQLLDALLGAAGDGPLLHELAREVRRVVLVEESLRLLEPLLAVLGDVDVVIEGAAELRRIAAFLARHRADAAPLAAELVRRELVRHPAVGVARDAPERALDDRLGGRGATLPGETGRVRGDPYRARLLRRPRLERDVVERVEPALVRNVLAAEERAQDRDPLFEASHALGGRNGHDRMLGGLRRVRLARPAQAHREQCPAAGEHVEARPLMRQHDW